MNEKYIQDKLNALSKSKFRSSFHLKKKDIEYIDKKGINTIKSHAFDFIEKRIAPQYIKNDGKQTPTKNHPVFIAQHATATCCRNCLYKWHHIQKNKQLNQEEQEYIVKVIMEWIKKEYKKEPKQ
ncbi:MULTISPECIES: DUF4186 domain-containing protein [Anaerofustis]|uniref:DUF4186 domain-containing protein n=2 Tax=Eubacteriaceae TaxID=186806 RepID=UPI0011073820|nr:MULTISPECIES: DUF4186 domain-containing protein [Anaerofustis]